MDFDKLIENILRQTGPGKRMSVCAYDTGWLARLGDVQPTLSRGALNWLRANQLLDGTWGVWEPLYFHDRLICTLSAMAALAQYGETEDIPRLERAQKILPNLIPALSQDLAGETVGFEMLVPSLLMEITASNFAVPVDAQWSQKLIRKRQAKLAMLPEGRINRNVTHSHSLEMLDKTKLSLVDQDNLIERDGSVGCSPAATAFWAKATKQVQPATLNYLSTYIYEGGIPTVVPIDNFEMAWVLWNFMVVDIDRQRFRPLLNPILDAMEKGWRAGLGVPGMSPFSCCDGDSTAVAFTTMAFFGRYQDLEAIFRYEAKDHFITYPLETHAGISSNIHFIEALLAAGLPLEHPAVQKIVGFLGRSRLERTYWFDKWNISPYYTTAHAIVVCARCAPALAIPAVEWLLTSQRSDGSWGFFYNPTAEETAYCLQALAFWRRAFREDVPLEVLKRGAAWLEANMDQPLPPMWHGKGLYCPQLVVQSAIVSALILVAQAT